MSAFFTDISQYLPWLGPLVTLSLAWWKRQPLGQGARIVWYTLWKQFHLNTVIFDLEQQLETEKRDKLAATATAEQALHMVSLFTQATKDLKSVTDQGLLIPRSSLPEEVAPLIFSIDSLPKPPILPGTL